MQRIYFTGKDLSRLRLITTLGPTVETVFALDLLRHGNNEVYPRWRQAAHHALKERPDAFRLLRDRDPTRLPWLFYRSPTSEEDPTNVVGVAMLADRRLDGLIREISRNAVIPYWQHIRRYLEIERDTRGRVAVTGGLGRLLGTLHSKMHWNPPVLEIPGDSSADIHLDGRGLLLCPSVFLVRSPAVLIRNQLDDGETVLVFSAPPDPARAPTLWGVPDHSAHALAALVGPTRASVLEVLTSSRTTTELAEQLGISSAGASQHTTVLRQAGLITTRRSRNTVVHSLTPLGVALLSGDTVERAVAADRGAG